MRGSGGSRAGPAGPCLPGWGETPTSLKHSADAHRYTHPVRLIGPTKRRGRHFGVLTDLGGGLEQVMLDPESQPFCLFRDDSL